MKYLALLIAALAISGCDSFRENGDERFSLFETSKGTVYLLNTMSGETQVIYPVVGPEKLVLHRTYKSEDGKIFEYQGAGKLREISGHEILEEILGKYED